MGAVELCLQFGDFVSFCDVNVKIDTFKSEGIFVSRAFIHFNYSNQPIFGLLGRQTYNVIFDMASAIAFNGLRLP